MHRPHGFTLAELMIVLALLGILLAIGVPAFSQLAASIRLTSAFNAVTASLAGARMAAVSHRAPVTVCPSADGAQCRRDLAWEGGWIAFLDPGRDGVPASADAILQRMDSLRGLAIHSTAGRHYIRYQPAGTSGGTNLTLRVCAGEPSHQAGEIVVNIAGRVYSRRTEGVVACPYTP